MIVAAVSMIAMVVFLLAVMVWQWRRDERNWRRRRMRA